MICFVDIEHEKVLRDPEKRDSHLALCTEIKLKLEEISGEACLVQHFSRVTGQRLREWGMKALIISGNAADWEEYGETDLAEMYRIIRAAELPILGLCGGLQLIALAHGAPLGPMRRLREEEDDLYAEHKPDYFKERGFMPVRILEPDPLFDGLGEEPVLFESHYLEIKKSPPHFRVLASTDECRIQAIKHKDKLVYGTQFHPEMYEEEQTDGRRLLANFFRLAGILK
jgi:GMP synthase (glutamine-hydrolysing)